MKSVGSLVGEISSKIQESAKEGEKGGNLVERNSPKFRPPAPTPPGVTNEALAASVAEIVKSYGLSGFEPPEDDVLIARAHSLAEEIPEIPFEWLSRVFTVARREYAPEPRVFHLLKAWREIVSDEYRSAIAARRPKVPPPPPPTEEERFAAFREMWIGCAAVGMRIQKETLEEYKITKEDIERKKFENICPPK